MNILEAINIEKQYAGHLALKNVSISVPEGSIFGLLGPNGAGKTTLIRIINQITAPDKGELYFNGRKMSQDDVSLIGYLPEERGLYKKMKVGEQATYLAQLKGLKKSIAIDRLKYLFNKMEMLSWWDKKVEELSKGMQQKVQFIVTILHSPKLLIFDEPFSGFDPINANMLKNEILQLRKDGATIIFSTHNMESVEELCDHITLINQAECILTGEINKIRNNFKSDTFEISLRGDVHNAQLAIQQNFTILENSGQEEATTWKIKLNRKDTENELLSLVIPHAKIIAFNEVFPRMSEIFIKSVENASSPSSKLLL